MRLVKPNWDIFKAKFSENPQENFEWFCYLLFSKEHNQTYGIHRYKNQSGIETDPIEVNNEVIGWQSKFYEDTLSNHKKDLIETLEKTKRDYHDITKIILYTNSEWGQGQGSKEPKAKIEAEEKAKELNIELAWRTKSYFESLFVCQEQRDISRYFFELESKWELTNLGFQDKLIQKYQTNFKTITLLLNDEKPIDDIFINLAIIKEQKEKDKKEEAYKREAILNSYEEIHKPKEPIEIKELLNISNKSLIYGKAGVGKTTLCKYIAYKWSKNELYEAFDYVVYIALREWKRDGLKGAILDNYYSSDIKELYFDIEENNSKILFLFDGYDELDADKKATLQKEIDNYKLQNYIITTRPYGYQKSDFKVDESFETIGFTDENVEAYIANFFDESQKEKSLKEFLQNNINIKHIAYIPLMLEMICSLWEDEEFKESVTMTELYGQVVENILKKHSALKNDESVYKRQNRKKINEQLGTLAFKGLTQQEIVFDGDFIGEMLEDIEFFEQSTINSGFLKSDNIDKDLLDNNFEFLHLTFQEYFSALYVSKLSKEEQSKIIRDWKFYPHMQMFFAFLGGLIKDKEFLLSEIESEPYDLVGVYELFLVVNCMSEMSKEILTEKRIKKINKDLADISIANIIYMRLNYETVLDTLKHFSHFMNIKTFKYFLKISKDDENNEFYIQKDMFDTLKFISKVNKDLKNILEKDKLFISFEKQLYLWDKNKNLFSIVINRFNQMTLDNMVILSYLDEIEYELQLENYNVSISKNTDLEKDKIINILNDVIGVYIPEWLNKHMEKLINNLYIDYSLEHELIEFLEKNPKLEDDCKNILFLLKNKEEIGLNLLKALQENKISILVQNTIVPHLNSYIDYTDKNINIILTVIENKYTDKEISSGLITFCLNSCIHSIYDNRIIDILIDIIINSKYIIKKEDKTQSYLEKNNAWEIYEEIYASNKEYIDGLIEIIKDETFLYEAIEKLSKISNENFYAFEEFLKLEVSEEEEEGVLNKYTRFLNSSVIFNAYRNGLDVCCLIDISLSNPKKVFYIRDNKFCTIENGKEICVDKKIIEPLEDNVND